MVPDEPEGLSVQGSPDTTPPEAEEWLDAWGYDFPTEHVLMDEVVLEVREDEMQGLG